MKKYPISISGRTFNAMEIVENYPEMLKGLEDRRELSADEGMIYVFPAERQLNFLSSNPWISIDVVFINESGKIVGTYTMRPEPPRREDEDIPQYQKRLSWYDSLEPALIAIELKEGTISELKLENGMQFPGDTAPLMKYRNTEHIKVERRQRRTALSNAWIAPALTALDKLISAPDDLFELNIKYAGAIFNLDILGKNGWRNPENVSPEKGSHIWFEKVFKIQQVDWIFRVVFSIKGHWRDCRCLIKKADGYIEEHENTVLPAEIRKIILGDLEATIQENTLKSAMEELDLTISDYLPLKRSDGKVFDENVTKFSLWARELKKIKGNDTHRACRLLYGMLRHGRFCDFGSVLGDALVVSADLEHKKAMAMLCKLSLTREKTSQNAYFWNSIGYVLDRLNMKDCAFFCFARAMEYSYDEIYAKNLWLMGANVVPEYLKQSRIEELLPIAEQMAPSFAGDISAEKLADIFCAIGMCYEYNHDFEEAKCYYKMAAKRIAFEKINESREEYHPETLRTDYPLGYQCLARLTMRDEACRDEYFTAQLKTFPKTPLEVGYQDRVPVNFIEGNGHGSHWGVMTRDVDAILTRVPEMVENGIPNGEGQHIPEYERGCGNFTMGVGYHYSLPEEKDYPVESFTLIGRTGERNELCSAYPIFKEGFGVRLKRKISEVSVCGNCLEGIADFYITEENQLGFFIPDYYRVSHDILEKNEYEIELAGFAYNLAKFQPHTFEIKEGPMIEEEKLELRKEGKDDNIDAVPVYMGEDMCNISRGFFGDGTDDISFIAKIGNIRSFKFLGDEYYEIILNFDERADNLKLPVFIGKHNLEDGYCPTMGDTVEGVLWMQGFLRGYIDNQEKSNVDNGVTGLSEGLLSAVRGKEYDLASLSVSALEQKSKAESIMPFKAELKCDPDFVCSINQQVRYIKVFTGFFETEEEYNKAFEEFRQRIFAGSVFTPIEAVALVGIKLGEEYYKIYYNGFSELNPVTEVKNKEKN